ncbi:MAG: bifunctional UDP-N-acetylglucosamine diphosphorylase/glucosamine-1-phosphate N-acetyltransferase GlmU [Mycoplasmatales bacterium]
MINAIVLGGGKGTRMKSELPKVVHQVLGYEMINLVMKELVCADVEKIVAVIGYKSEVVKERLDPKFKVKLALQPEQLGTGHAVSCALDQLDPNVKHTIITFGDTPLITSETYQLIINEHTEEENQLTVLSTRVDNPVGYGRIIRTADDRLLAIVEEKDCDSEQRGIKEVNSGVMCVETEMLLKYIPQIKNNNAQAEYYLTDLVELMSNDNLKVGVCVVADYKQLEGVNDLVSLSRVAKVLQNRINYMHQINGVNILDPKRTYIGPNVSIGVQTIIEPGTSIMGETNIGKNNHILSNTKIDDTTIGDHNSIGPMAYLREKAVIGSNCRIGNFVEIKKSTLADGVKCAHLTYIGDATVGSNVNFGCGSITVNYDGKNKYQTIIGNNVMIGSNVNLIAPITVGDGAFIAAGTTVSNDVKEDKLIIGRVKAQVKEKLRWVNTQQWVFQRIIIILDYLH